MILPVHHRMILVFLSIMVVSVPPVVACDVILVEYYYSASCEPCQAKTEIINHIEHNFSTRVLVIRKEAGSNQTNYDQWRAYGFQYYPSVVINKNIAISKDNITQDYLETIINTLIANSDAEAMLYGIPKATLINALLVASGISLLLIAVIAWKKEKQH